MTTSYYNLSSGNFSQDWSDNGLITTDNDWSGVPSIVGYSSSDVTSATGVDAQTVLTDSGFSARVIANQAATNTTGAIIEVQATNSTIAFQGSNNSDYHALVFYMDATDRKDITFTANIRDLDAGADNAIQQFALQYRIGNTGNWTNLPAAYIADATTAGSATQVTPVSVLLPAIVNGSSELQIRALTTNAAGNDELIGVDDIVISSTSLGGGASIAITDVTTTEGDAGTKTMTFTVSLSEAAPAGGVTFDIATADGTATAGSDYVAKALTGQTIPEGATSYSFSVTVNGDSAVESNETFFVNLTNVTGATVADAQGQGTITNDDAGITRIHDIQGAQHTSPLVGQTVTVQAIVTAVASNGFYLQEKNANADASLATSEGIFVFTSSTPNSSVVVGNELRLTGTVSEFFPGGASTGNLSTTELVSTSNYSVISTGNAAPSATIIGDGGRAIPTEVIHDATPYSGSAALNLAQGMDFFESMEGMLVTVNDPLAVAGTNSFGEIYTVGDAGANATGLSGDNTIVIDPISTGGINVTNSGAGSDFNPERIQIDMTNNLVGSDSPLLVDAGTILNDVTGVLDYDFGNFQILPTVPVTVQTASTLAPEVTNVLGDAGNLTIAQYNVLNLDINEDPSEGQADQDIADGRFAAIAQQIVANLGSPDIIGLQEVQDNSGGTNDGTVAANLVLQALVDAIVAAGGPQYSFIDNTLITNNTSGGQPGGNIRNAYLYNDARVDLVPGSVTTTTDAVTDFAGSRLPLVATFAFNGEEVTVINNHFSSKGGSTPLYGTTQLSINGSADERLVQAQNVADYVTSLGSDAKVVVLGDLNEFSEEESLAPLINAGLIDLEAGLPQDEQYSYIFDGNAQVLDHIMLSSNLTAGSAFDIVHVNPAFAFTDATASDHDPSIVSLALGDTNVGPEFTSPSLFSVEENQTVAAQLTATDADGDTLIYTITGGLDADLFEIDAATGLVSFKTAPNFEAPADFGGDNVYDVDVAVDDGNGLVGEASLAITLGDANDGPLFTSPSAFSVEENQTVAAQLTAADEDGDALIYTISGGLDADLFEINATTGVVSFKTAPDFEAPADFGGDNVYDVDVAVDDSNGLVGEASLAITVTDVADGLFTLQLLHFADGEAGLLASQTAPYMAALADAFEDDYVNSITLAGGDNFIPGPFFAAGADPSITSVIPGGNVQGRPDIAIHNAIGVQASTIGNHEFDFGSQGFRDAFGASGSWVGAQFPYLSSNLDFSGDSVLNPVYVNTLAGAGLEEASANKGKIVPSAIITENGEQIGIVGITTQLLEQISSPTGTEVKGFPTGPGANGEFDNMTLLASQVQVYIDDLIAQGVNKIILMSHLQLINNEKTLAPLLNGVDIILAAGSNTRLGDADDEAVAFPGHAADFADTYPIVTAGADGKTTVIVNTDNEYTYLGRLVVDFDANGEIIAESLTANVSVNGAYAATEENVAEAWGDLDGDLSDTAFAEGTRGETVDDITGAVQAVIDAKTSNIYGYSDVYLEGARAKVRFEETNLGDVSADANADAARDALGLAADNAIVSLKNGGGIRAQIGTVSAPDPIDGTVDFLPNAGGVVTQLDVENSLRFNNALMVFDTTAQGLLNILNNPAGLTPGNGGFIQIGGIEFSYDPTLAAGSRVRDIALVNEYGEKIAVIADDGVVVAGAPASITMVALNFTANGGDGFAVKANAGNFRYLLADGTVSAAVDEALDFTATTTINTYAGSSANLLGEQKAFADYFAENFGTPDEAFDIADTDQSGDLRIQNQAARTDTVLSGTFVTIGSAAVDIMNGTTGNDILKGLAGNDQINGDAGDDTLVGGLGRDRMDGGEGIDTASYANAASAIVADLGAHKGSYGEALGDTLKNIENLTGSAFDDALFGDRDANVLDGGEGNDNLEGAGGNDTLVGGAGNDVLRGGLGIDSLTGGAGDDIFVFAKSDTKKTMAEADTIADFVVGDDLIDLSELDANLKTKLEDDAFAFIGTGAFTKVAGQLHYEVVGGDAYVSGDVTGDGKADFMIHLVGVTTLSAADFVL